MAGIVIYGCLVIVSLLLWTQDLVHRVEVNELKRKLEKAEQRGKQE